jgi:hypothetical protein
LPRITSDVATFVVLFSPSSFIGTGRLIVPTHFFIESSLTIASNSSIWYVTASINLIKEEQPKHQKYHRSYQGTEGEKYILVHFFAGIQLRHP